jgi:C-terminal processing protease CtpA/Prc
MGAMVTLAEFRAGLAADTLTVDDRRRLVDQAEALLEGLYVHLPLKRAMHAVDPLQCLRLLRHRIPELTEDEFHRTLLQTFLDLRDLHTTYVLPQRYQRTAFLGILVERHLDDAGAHVVISKVWDRLVGEPNLVPGVEITHWNGTPIATAVDRNAEREAGSNPAARRARGLERLTMRSIHMSLPPDEDWVTLTYSGGEGAAAQVHESRLPWRVFDRREDITGDPAVSTLPAGVDAAAEHLVGLDLQTEVARRVKRRLFAPASLDEERRVRRSRAAVPRATAAQAEADVVPTTRPGELKARTITTSRGTFGHLRIYTFHMQDRDVTAFVQEVARLLGRLPQNGLVLDVRGNGGGFVIAAEYLLQYLTPRTVTPEPMQFVNTRATAELCRTVADYAPWRASVDESIETGAQYSSALPLYPPSSVNAVGQLYHGPVVLVTDALCYSACDIFAAGFQDHGIGPVVGVDANTGAGGANVVTHRELRGEWTGGPLAALPGRADFRIALRRCLRVGDRFGQPVEDLGVVPDLRHELTRRDLLADNADLMEFAGSLLAQRRARELLVQVAPAGEGVTLNVTTGGLTGIDVYVDGRPVGTATVTDGSTPFALPHPPANAVVRIEGFDGTELVAARRIALGP